MPKHSTSQNPLFRTVVATALAVFLSFATADYCLAEEQDAKVANVAPIQYQISFDQRANHYVDVRLTLVADPTTETVDLFLPVWTPGSYLVREYARHVDQVEAIDDQGQTLKVVKTSKNSWSISKNQSTRIVVTYSVYCNELSVRTNFVDAELAVLNGAATFLTTEAILDQPHGVEVKLPEDWKRSVTALPKSEAGNPHHYLASTYDVLVDSPILVGNPSVFPFSAGGVEHYLVNQGGDEFWDGETAAADAAKIVAEHQRMWGEIPYERYYFLNVIAEAGGGLEHDNSTLLMTSRWSFRAPKSYKRWLGLVSHEFFHTWNVRRLRPAGLQKYDYLHENYFDELWVAEGITSYYDDLALVRSGVTNQKEYLSALSDQIKSVQTTPGRLRQSLQQSSHDAWIKFYRPDENSANSSISYYSKGAIVGFLLDAEIRQRTNNAKSLDDVMRQLWSDFAKQQKGYTNEDVLAIVEQLTGADFDQWFEQAIYAADELQYDSALAWYGLKFKVAEKEEEKAPTSGVESMAVIEAAVAEKPKTASFGDRISLGVSTENNDGLLTVRRVLEGTAAAQAGLNVGDELIALDGYRLSGSLDSRLEQYRPGQSVQLLIARRGKLAELVVKLTADEQTSWSLEPVKEPTEQQLSNMRDWLRLPEKD